MVLQSVNVRLGELDLAKAYTTLQYAEIPIGSGEFILTVDFGDDTPRLLVLKNELDEDYSDSWDIFRAEMRDEEREELLAYLEDMVW